MTVQEQKQLISALVFKLVNVMMIMNMSLVNATFLSYILVLYNSYTTLAYSLQTVWKSVTIISIYVFTDLYRNLNW